jgi:DNA-binding FrmR family transcriptional regulator
VKPDPKLLSRLSRIEGQVRGIARMLEQDRYCIDILDQIQAVKAALRKVEDEVLKNHSAHCVADAIQGGAKDARRKFDELIELFSRYSR